MSQEAQEQFDLDPADIPPENNGDIAPDEPQYSDAEARAREHGWLPLDEYEANGGNPEMWRAAGAFNQFFDERKKFDGEIKGMKQSMQKLTDGFNTLTAQQRDKHKRDLEAALETAKNNVDVEGVQSITSQLSEIDKVESQEQEVPKQQGEMDIVVNFRQSNPVLDMASAEFNPDINAAVEGAVNRRVMAMAKQGQEINDDVAMRLMREELKRVQDTFGGNKKRTPPPTNNPKRGGTQKSAVEQLSPEAREIYDIIAKSQSKEAAEEFAKNQLEA